MFLPSKLNCFITHKLLLKYFFVFNIQNAHISHLTPGLKRICAVPLRTYAEQAGKFSLLSLLNDFTNCFIYAVFNRSKNLVYPLYGKSMNSGPSNTSVEIAGWSSQVQLTPGRMVFV